MPIKSMAICPGVDLEVYDFCTESLFTFSRNQEATWSLRLDYCLEGRMEADFTGHKHAQIEAEQLAINSSQYGMLSSYFPFRIYRGLSLLFYEEKLPQAYTEMLETLDIRLSEMNAKVNKNKVWLLQQVPEEIQPILKDFYHFIEKIEAFPDHTYYWIRVMHLLYVVKYRVKAPELKAAYFSGSSVETIKSIVKEELMSGTAEHNIPSLVQASGMSTASFYQLFKDIYGLSPARYFRNFALNRAASRLLSTAEPIQKIASEAGYDNFSKFSSAFRKLYQQSPSEYRRKGSFFDKECLPARMGTEKVRGKELSQEKPFAEKRESKA